MKIHLYVPCFVDQFFPQAGMAMVRVLESLGHEVAFEESILCCGQPAFNSGYWEEARAVAIKTVEALQGADVVVIGSGSCGAMIQKFYPELFKGTPHEAQAKALVQKTFEFSDFLYRRLKVTDLGARFPHKVTYHDGCHGLRELGIKQAPRELLKQVKGLTLVEMKEAESCCGFGGTFAAKYPSISTAMGEGKCASALETNAEYIVSGDSSCLMQIQGLLSRQNKSIKPIHLAEILVSR
jgi:L-lactate dehydrogenase complex protein LldE